ncbi:hypothetical protein GGS23DRAFT_194797 [Durotheca rogersii]|uniref:uncharacterized protein n=1 Tax=Durotheca rogersii TaxID=419775 RepID=UPI00222093CD|nr:uncharacterized protein GGS23DRAFT_194797 [Durotheca rogersii]KAI5867776.1 hypothetical protein GGS23DRAFT_194797 [Durotheca rogersii]
MKVPTASLCALLFGAWALAAPAATADGLPHPASLPAPASRTGRFLLSLLGPPHVSVEKAAAKILVTSDGRRVRLPENLAGARAWETPNVLRYLLSTMACPGAMRKSLSPFPESSILREETGADGDTEPQETIVELETQAERESWTYVPYYVSRDDVLRFRRVHRAADTVMIAFPVGIVATILLSSLWAAVRQRHRLSSSLANEEGEVCLGDEEKALDPTYHSYLVTCSTPRTEPSLGRTTDENS